MSETSNERSDQASGALSARRFGWSDMFVHPDEDPRTDSGFQGERATLVGYLRDQRLTLELKCSGLDAAELARRSVEPSNLSLLGLVRHMAEVERGWFRRRLAGQDAPPLYRTDDDRDADFNGAAADPELVEEAWKTWRDEVTFARNVSWTRPPILITWARKGTACALFLST